MRAVNIGIAMVISIITGGCATIIHGTTQDISVTTDPPGAVLIVDGREKYISPAIITMKRKDPHAVIISLQDYQNEIVNIKQTMSTATFGDLLIAGGYIVDAATGAQCRLVPERVNVVLRPLTTQEASEEAKNLVDEQLKQLKIMRYQGTISQEEYIKIRQEIEASPGKGNLAPVATPKK